MSNTLYQIPIFSPTQIAGCQLWLDAADSSTMTLSGNSITQWRDKSGNGRNAVGNTGTGSYSANGFNSLPTVQITPTGNMISSVPAGTFPSGIVVFVAFQKTGANATPAETVVTRIGPFGYPSPYDIYTGFAGPGTSRLTGNGSSAYGNTYTASDTICRTTTPTIWGFSIFSSSPLNWFDTVNGTVTNYTLTPTGGTVAYGDTATSIVIGSRADNYTKMRGNISEIIVYSASSFFTSQYQQIEGYLAWKWGLVGNLPANHPYKNSQVSNINTIPRSLQTSLRATMAPSQSAFFSPTQIFGCQVWLDGADPNGTGVLPANGTALSTWVDKSGSGNSMTAVGSPQPTYLSQSRSISYNGSSYFQKTSISFTNYTFFAIARKTSGNGPLYTNTTTTPYSGFFPNYSANGNYYLVRANATMNDTNWASAPSSFADGTTYMYSIRYAPDSNINVWANGGINATISTTQTGTITQDSILLGKRSASGGSETWIGIFSEVIQYNNALSTAQRQQVEGYLAWKWGLVTSLPSSHPFKNRPPLLVGPNLITPPLTRQLASGVFSPLRFSQCVLWLDAADPNGNGVLPLNGASITTWRDKSGNGRNATAGNAPTLSYNYQNNLPAILFNGSSTFLNLPNFTSVPISIFMVARSIVNAGNTFYIALGPSRIMVREIPGSPSYFGVDGSNPVYGAYATSIRDTNYHIWSFVLPASANGFLNLDGTLRSSSGFIAPANTSINSNTIGAWSQQAAGNLNGAINEILFYNSALSTSQVQQIEGYLAWKWGLVGSLPANHPFKKWPPPA